MKRRKGKISVAAYATLVQLALGRKLTKAERRDMREARLQRVPSAKFVERVRRPRPTTERIIITGSTSPVECVVTEYAT